MTIRTTHTGRKLGSGAVTFVEVNTIIAIACESYVAAHTHHQGLWVLTAAAVFGILLNLAMGIVIGQAYYKGEPE